MKIRRIQNSLVFAATDGGDARERGFSRTLGQLADFKMALVAIELREHLRCRSCRARMAHLHESAR